MRIAVTILCLLVFTACASKKVSQKMSTRVIPTDGIVNTIPAPVTQSQSDSSGLWDIDGNHYKIIQVRSQIWMAENLRVTRFSDGTDIPYLPDNGEWGKNAIPAYCWINNDSANYASTYGALYNWYTVNTGKLCPSGWHVPSNTDWDILINHLGGADIAGGKLKEADTIHWNKPNTGATNETGFTALPAGGRTEDGTFGNFGQNNIIWSSTEFDSGFAWFRNLSYYYPDVFGYCFNKRNGFSVRCVKDR